MSWSVSSLLWSGAQLLYPDHENTIPPQTEASKIVEWSKSLMSHGRCGEAIDACFEGLAFHPEFLKAYRPDKYIVDWDLSKVGMPIDPQGKLWEKGRSVKEETLLLFSLGDTGHFYLFAKLIPRLLDKGAQKIFVLIPDGIIDLFQNFFSDLPQVVLISDPKEAFFWTLCLPVNLLPKVCAVQAEAFPKKPYLVASEGVKISIKQLFSSCTASLKIGMILPKDLSDSATKALIGSVNIFGSLLLLSGGSGPLEGIMVDLSPQLPNWGERAAAIDLCDVIITCDGALAHLSAGLGKRTLVLTRGDAHPLWLKGLLYENAVEFRQDLPEDWRNISSRLYRYFEENHSKWKQNL